MESFFRYIAYVDYYRDGEKVRNVGFLRWKLYNSVHCVEIQLKDVGNFRGVCEIKEKNTNKILGRIVFDKGIGSFANKFPAMSENSVMYIDGEDDRICLSDVKGFVVRLNRDEYLSVDVEFEQAKEPGENALKSSGNFNNEDRKALPCEETIKTNNKKDLNQIVIEEVTELEYEQHKKDIEVASENILAEGISEKYTDFAYMQTIKIIEPFHDNKWEQLCKEYPRVHPFSGKRTFLSIKPEDFIILQQEYQKLVHNSFLLHGFYNYGHMILGKLSEEEEAPIYIGVPGVYYEREKQAARMFGFVGFESTEQPVQSGSYGYYMIEVKI